MTGSSVVEQVIGVAEVQCHVPVIHDVYTALASSLVIRRGTPESRVEEQDVDAPSTVCGKLGINSGPIDLIGPAEVMCPLWTNSIRQENVMQSLVKPGV